MLNNETKVRNKHSGFETSKDFKMVGDTLDLRHFVAEMFRRTKDDFIVPVHNELDFKNHDFFRTIAEVFRTKEK